MKKREKLVDWYHLTEYEDSLGFMTLKLFVETDTNAILENKEKGEAHSGPTFWLTVI